MPPFPALLSRTTSPTSTPSSLPPGSILISRNTLILTLILFSLSLLLSWAGLAYFLIRAYLRRRRAQQARQWGRKSRFDARISLMKKEVDDSFSQQYTGCWHAAIPENPCMGSDSPVEIMTPERVWEVAAGEDVPRALAMVKKTMKSPVIGGRGAGRVKSLFFDNKLNMWMQKR